MFEQFELDVKQQSAKHQAAATLTCKPSIRSQVRTPLPEPTRATFKENKGLKQLRRNVRGSISETPSPLTVDRGTNGSVYVGGSEEVSTDDTLWIKRASSSPPPPPHFPESCRGGGGGTAPTPACQKLL